MSLWGHPGNGYSETRMHSEEVSNDGREPENHGWDLSYGKFSLLQRGDWRELSYVSKYLRVDP